MESEPEFATYKEEPEVDSAILPGARPVLIFADAASTNPPLLWFSANAESEFSTASLT